MTLEVVWDEVPLRRELHDWPCVPREGETLMLGGVCFRVIRVGYRRETVLIGGSSEAPKGEKRKVTPVMLISPTAERLDWL